MMEYYKLIRDVVGQVRVRYDDYVINWQIK